MGDIAGADVDDVVLKYLGTVSMRQPAQPLTAQPPVILYPPAHLRRQAWHLRVCLMGMHRLATTYPARHML